MPPGRKQNVYAASGMQMLERINVISFPAAELLKLRIEFFRSNTSLQQKYFCSAFLSFSQHSIIPYAVDCFYNCSKSRAKGVDGNKGKGNNFLEDCASTTIKMFMGDSRMTNISSVRGALQDFGANYIEGGNGDGIIKQ